MPDTASPNVDHRSQQVRDALERSYKLDREIESCMEEYIEPLRADKRDIKRKLRDDLDIPIKRFNGRYAQYREERRAIDNHDQTTLDAIRYLYSVAEVGEQVNWIDGLDTGDDDEPGFMGEDEPEDADA